MSRYSPNDTSTRASTPQPQPKPPSTLQALIASVPGGSFLKSPSTTLPPSPIAPRKPSPLQALLASVPDDSSSTKSLSPPGSPYSSSDFSVAGFPPPPQNLVLPNQPEHHYPGQPEYLAQPLLYVPPRLHHSQIYQQQQIPQASRYIQPLYISHPPSQFPQQQQVSQQYSDVPSQYYPQPPAQFTLQPKSDRELKFIRSEYELQMAQQQAGKIKPAAVAKPATRINKVGKPAVMMSKPKANASAQTKPVASKSKPATQTKAKAAPKVAPKAAPKAAPKSAPETKITGEEHKKVARFDWLLRTFLNSLNAIYDEFGGIPDQIKIVDDGFGRHHGKFNHWLNVTSN